MSQQDDATLSCAAGCKRTVLDQMAAEQAGWEYLPIAGRYRCQQCGRELREANKPRGEPTKEKP